VPETGSSTIRRRWLAAALRELRESAGLTGAQAAERLRWSVSKISRTETGHYPVKQDELRLLLDLYRAGESRREEVLALARNSSKTAWVDAAIAGFPEENALYVYAEAEAISISDWEPQAVPGLLQTGAYAREVIQGWHSMFNLPPLQLDQKVEARLKRQQILTRDQPPDLAVVMDESVIFRRQGDNAVMRNQLKRLAECADMANVDLRIIRLDGRHPISSGGFTFMRFAHQPDAKMRDFVAAEQLVKNVYVESLNDTNQYRVAFEYLQAEALDPASSRELIARVSRRLWA
jgi:transcriptional regulator with XRE-family HTH domain